MIMTRLARYTECHDCDHHIVDSYSTSTNGNKTDNLRSTVDWGCKSSSDGVSNVLTVTYMLGRHGRGTCVSQRKVTKYAHS